MVNFGPLAAEIVSLVWGTPADFNGFRVLAALLHGTLVVGVSQTYLRRSTQGATYIRHDDAPADPQVGPPTARECGARTLRFASSALVPNSGAQIMVTLFFTAIRLMIFTGVTDISLFVRPTGCYQPKPKFIVTVILPFTGHISCILFWCNKCADDMQYVHISQVVCDVGHGSS